MQHQRRQLILVAEDEEDYLDYVCGQLRRDDYDIMAVADGAAAMEYIDVALMDPFAVPLPDLMVTDLRMPCCDGLELLSYAGFIPTIVMTAFGAAETRATALRLGARYVFDKPFDTDDLRTAVRSIVHAEHH